MRKIKQKDENLITNEIIQVKIKDIINSFIYKNKLKNNLNVKKRLKRQIKNFIKIV